MLAINLIRLATVLWQGFPRLDDGRSSNLTSPEICRWSENAARSHPSFVTSRCTVKLLLMLCVQVLELELTAGLYSLCNRHTQWLSQSRGSWIVCTPSLNLIWTRTCVGTSDHNYDSFKKFWFVDTESNSKSISNGKRGSGGGNSCWISSMPRYHPFISISKWQTFRTDSKHIGLPSWYISKYCGSYVEFLEGFSLGPASTETKNG